MKITELRQKSKEELSSLLEAERAGLEDLKTLVLGGKQKDVTELGKIKKRIARILTLLNEDRN